VDLRRARSRMATAFGVALGQLVWVVTTSVGLVAVLLASAPVPPLDAHMGRSLTLSRAIRHGLTSDLANPKMAVFANVLPQFAPQSGGMLSILVLLGVIFAAMTLLWLVLYSVAITTVGGILQRSAMRRVLEGAMGGVLVLLGIRLPAEQRAPQPSSPFP
jgi:threonine/homoserine/homoserine lactone efflux protein